MIHYEIISEAIKFYEDRGYQIKDMPWIASTEAINSTLPPGATATNCDNGILVGSAEQSFIDALLLDNELDGIFQATTPCFRNDEEDELHKKYFIKTELFLTAKHVSKPRLRTVIQDALDFFSLWPPGIKPKVVKMGDDMFDIVDSTFNIELGSYGIRIYKNHKWIYGTGCAEPRLSTVIEKCKSIRL